MKVIEVIPIARSIFAPGTLSYFSIKPISRGDLVKIGLRGKETFAIVEKSSDVAEEKVALKKSGFKLKPIKAVVCEKFFSDNWFKILEGISKNLMIPPHIALSSLLSKAILSRELASPEESSEERGYRKYAVKGSFEDRADYLRGITREHFARKKSLVIVSPRIENLLELKAALGRGIEEYIFCFSSKLSAKKYLSEYNKAVAQAHPVLILGTPQILFFSRPDLETLALDDEGSRLWRDKSFYSFDFRQSAEIIAKARKLKLIFSGQILRVETIYRSERGLIEAKNTLTGRIQNPVETRIIEVGKSTNFSWISGDLARYIEESLRCSEKVFLLANRKGYTSFTLCQDSSRPQLCQKCSIPLVLHGTNQQRKFKFICHHCLKSQTVPERCQSCSSWKLKNFGLGIEKVAEEFENLFPKTKFTILDQDNKNAGNKFESVVIGTEVVFSHPKIFFDTVAIISLDNLFTIPDFRINETIFRLVSELKYRAEKRFILQTRLSGNKLLQDAVSGNLSSFYQDEIESRKALGYPPFVKIIKLSAENKNLSLLNGEEKKAMLALKNYNPISFPAFREKINGNYRWNILLKISGHPTGSGWPDDKLRSLLESLSRVWQVSVDPESII